MDDKKLLKKIEAIIVKTLKKEGGASGLKPLKKAIEKLDKPKKFNLIKTLAKMKNVKKHKDSDYILTPINENSFTKLDIKNLIKESVKEIKEGAYNDVTLTHQGSHRTGAIAPTDEYPFSVRPKRTATGMYEGGQSWGLDIRELADSFTFEELEQLEKDNKISKEDLEGAKGYLQAWIDMHPTYLPQRDLTSPKRQKIRATYGIDENSIRINMEQAPPEGEEKEKEKKPKVKENPPKHSLEKIGECKAACTDLEIENLEVKVENVELKLKDLAKRRSDAKPSEVEGMEKERKELLLQMKALDDQIEVKEQEKEKLKNPEKEDQKESKIKKNMKANVKQLWNDYAKERINSSLNEKVNHYRKLARRKVLQEGVMSTFFEYFNQGHTNEEIVQLYAEKGVAVPEQFVGKARKTFEAQTKLNAEMEMSELNFKNEASQIVNNPATMEMDGSVTMDDKQLAAGLFKEQDEAPEKPEKEASDVSAFNDEIKKINTEDEFSSVLKKLLNHSDEVSGLSDSKVKALLMKSIKEL